jgi:asparagine synthase (glutamine-hydrolysing)
MFALGFWDDDAGRLLLARDRIGIKPLYYAPLREAGSPFASELHPRLLEHPAVDRALDPQALLSLFPSSTTSPPPQTIVRGACKLERGHFLTWTSRQRSSRRPAAYWTLGNGSSR